MEAVVVKATMALCSTLQACLSHEVDPVALAISVPDRTSYALYRDRLSRCCSLMASVGVLSLR
jgi:hypothetical protein